MSRFIRGSRYQIARVFRRNQPLVSARSVNGLRFACLPSDAVGRWIYRCGLYEAHILTCLKKNLRFDVDDLAIDIGANIGWYSCIFGSILRDRGQVIAIEPEPRNLQLLQKNIQLNNLANIEAIQCAASDQPGTLSLHLYKSSNRGRHSVLPIYAGPTIKIPAARLDDLLEQRGLGSRTVAILKIDIEGYEAIALRGATRALSRCRLALVEWSPNYMLNGGIEPAELADLLLISGFSLAIIHGDGTLVPIDREQLLAEHRQVDLLCRRESRTPSST